MTMTLGNADTFIVSVSGASGSGKTALVGKLSKLLDGATIVSFDDYKSTTVFPADIAQWIADECDPSHVKCPQLDDDLRKLRQGKSITGPEEQLYTPSRFILVEEPFGKGRQAMAELVDFSVCIDSPEIALARVVMRGIETEVQAHTDLEVFLHDMNGYLRNYVLGVRDLYRIVNQGVMKNCDLIIDGTRSVEELASEVALAIRQNATSVRSL